MHTSNVLKTQQQAHIWIVPENKPTLINVSCLERQMSFALCRTFM